MQLQDKVAVVTGAAQGLGKAIALAMAQEGADLVICDIQPGPLQVAGKEIEALGRRCLTVDCDVSSSQHVAAMFDSAKRRNRHYAYITKPVARQSLGITTGLSDEDWLKWWDVNVHGTFYCTREALKRMEPQRHGKIINIASIAGISAGSAHSPGYSASKAAVANLTKTVALDEAGANIYVNAIACGAVLTPPFEAYMAKASDEQKATLFQMIPLGRLGTPEEYACLAVWLAGDNHYITGQVISPNGGLVI